MNFKVFTFLFSSLILAVIADVPTAINYQGRLTDANGAPVTGSKNFTLSIYDGETEGSLLYSEDIGAVTLDDNGVYSFQFGESGASQATATKSVGVADGVKNVFNTVLPEEAIGIVSVTDGTYTWTPEAGSTAPTSFIGSYDGASKTVSAIYIGGAPSGGVEILAVYKSETGGISAALASGNGHWLELAIDGTTQSSRERILAVPFAQRSNVANKALEGVDSEARSQIQALVQSVSRNNIHTLVGPGNVPNSSSNYVISRVQAVGSVTGRLDRTFQGTVSPESGQPTYLSRIVFDLYVRFETPRIGWYQINYSDGESVRTDFNTNQSPVTVDNLNKNKKVESVGFSIPSINIGGASARCSLFGRDAAIINYNISGAPLVTKGAIALYPTIPKTLTDVSIVLEFANGESVTTEANRFVELSDRITKITVIARSPDGAKVESIKLLY